MVSCMLRMMSRLWSKWSGLMLAFSFAGKVIEGWAGSLSSSLSALIVFLYSLVFYFYF